MKVPGNLIGPVPELECFVNGVSTLSLIDSGSQITSLAYSFYCENLSDIPLQDISNLLKVESAGGFSLPYEGFIEVTLSIPVSDVENFEITVPILIVPDTNYNKNVPLLIGTNVLNFLTKFENTTNVQSLKCALHAMVLGYRHLEKNDGIYSRLTTEDALTIPPHTGIQSTGKSVVVVPICQNQIAMVQTEIEDLPVVSGIVNIKHGVNDIPFEIFNNSDETLYIGKGEHIGNIHQVKIQAPESPEMTEFLDAFNMSHLDESGKVELRSFLSKHRDVFAMNLHELGCTPLTEFRIEMSDSTPFKEKIRPCPPGMYDELKSHIAELLSAGIIEESNSPFSSNVVLVRKKDQSLRMCIDYRKINSRTISDSYSIPRVDTLIDSLRGAKYFASLDLMAGYHQINVCDEHKERTAFSTTCGFFQMKKLPFGLKNAVSDF